MNRNIIWCDFRAGVRLNSTLLKVHVSNGYHKGFVRRCVMVRYGDNDQKTIIQLNFGWAQIIFQKLNLRSP
jgi:hypothetical protein